MMLFRKKKAAPHPLARRPLPRGLGRVRAYAEAWDVMVEQAKVGTEEQQRLFKLGVPERDILEAILELDERTR